MPDPFPVQLSWTTTESEETIGPAAISTTLPQILDDVRVGERIAEVQEEILWLCEAAHLPGIWATQVLEKLTQSGLATRAEITDAAMSARAECVMLNKDPYIDNAVATLRDIIHRMEKHQFKRKSNLRPLSVACRFLEGKTMKLANVIGQHFPNYNFFVFFVPVFPNRILVIKESLE